MAKYLICLSAGTAEATADTGWSILIHTLEVMMMMM
jgi:hypothetical protein